MYIDLGASKVDSQKNCKKIIVSGWMSDWIRQKSLVEFSRSWDNRGEGIK